MLRVSLFGEFNIQCDGAILYEVLPPRLQSLLSFLLLHRGVPQTRSHLAFLFWPDTSEAQSRTNLRNLLYQLRHALPFIDDYLIITGQYLLWRSDPQFFLDVEQFQQATSRMPKATQEDLEEILNLYKGDLLPGCFDEWIFPVREELRDKYIRTMEDLSQKFEEQGDYASALRCVQKLLLSDPLYEVAYQHLIRLFALNNNRAAALRAYHVCETILQRELNAKPLKATREAYENLVGEESQSLISSSTTAFFPIVGREQEWAQMLKSWRAAIANQGPKLLLLCGEAGIGKTRLLEEMIQWAIHQGIPNLNANCHAAEGELAYAPVINWLRAHSLLRLEDTWLVEIARLLPEILLQRRDLPKPNPISEDWQREHLFEALSQAFLGLRQPFLLTIDNLQWCDRDSMQWMHFLLRFDLTSRFLIIGTYRPEEITSNHPLNLLLQTLSFENGVAEINLSSLDEKATEKLASNVVGEELTRELSLSLFHHSEGNPLFIIEMLRAGIPVNTLYDHIQPLTFSHDSKVEEVTLPTKVQSILEARIGQLSQPSLELAQYAAVIGREFNVSLLGKASGLDDDELVNEIDELWRRRIVREHGVDAYDFSHDKLGEVVYKSMSTSRRRLLHKQVAIALETSHSHNLASVSHQLALHFEKAGLLERAVPYYLLSAEEARKVYANQDARILIQRGLELVEKLDLAEEQHFEVVERLWENLGDLHLLSAEHKEALADYRKAQENISPQMKIVRARLFRKTAETFKEEQHYSDTLEFCQKAEAILGKQPEGDFDQWWDEWIDVQIEKVWAYYWLAQWNELEALVERISVVVNVRASGISRMQFLMASCLMNLRKYRYVVSNEMLTNSKESLEISQKLGSLHNQMECQFELGFLYLWRYELKKAEDHLLTSLDLAKNAGDVFFQTLSLTYLAVLNRFRGQVEEVSSYTQQMQQLAESAHMPDYLATAKANLAWIALRRGDLVSAKHLAIEALAIWHDSPMVYPFQWLALWTLIEVALNRGDEKEVWDYLSVLIAETQQQPQQAVDDLLQESAKHQMRGYGSEAISSLKKAVSIAKESGYL